MTTRWAVTARDLPWWRRIVVMAAALPAIGAWNNAEVWPPVWLLVAVLLLLHVDRTWAQLSVRAALWVTLLAAAGTAAKLPSAPATAIALLALGSAALGERPGEPFRPLACRGLLLALLVVGGAQLLLLGLLGVRQSLDFSPWMLEHPRRIAFELVWLALVGAGVFGLYRLRVWGLFVGSAASLGLLSFTLLGNRRVAGIVWLPLRPLEWVPLTVGFLALVATVAAVLARGRPSAATALVRHHARPALIVALALFAVARHVGAWG